MPAASSSDLSGTLRQLEHNISSNNHKTSTSLLSKAKLALLHANALVPSANTPPQLLQQAQHTLELGALISIRLQDPAAFTRYFQQLQPFYFAAPAASNQSQRSKITGLFLLLLLSQGDYAGFHTLLESLEVMAGQGGKGIDEDDFVQYPIRLEQWLMEGSYDRVWQETKSDRVPSEEFAIFSGVRHSLLLCYKRCKTNRRVDSYWHDSLRGRLVLGEGVPLDSCDECKEPSLPGQRRQRSWVL